MVREIFGPDGASPVGEQRTSEEGVAEGGEGGEDQQEGGREAGRWAVAMLSSVHGTGGGRHFNDNMKIKKEKYENKSAML